MGKHSALIYQAEWNLSKFQSQVKQQVTEKTSRQSDKSPNAHRDDKSPNLHTDGQLTEYNPAHLYHSVNCVW